MSRSIVLVVAVVLALVLVLDQVNSAPSNHHKRHARCEERLYKTLTTLCNHKGNVEIMRDMARTCCESNCDMMEMMSACTGKSSEEEAQQAASIREIEDAKLFS